MHASDKKAHLRSRWRDVILYFGIAVLVVGTEVIGIDARVASTLITCSCGFVFNRHTHSIFDQDFQSTFALWSVLGFVDDIACSPCALESRGTFYHSDTWYGNRMHSKCMCMRYNIFLHIISRAAISRTWMTSFGPAGLK